MKNEMKYHNYEINNKQIEAKHTITCSISCDHEKHEKHGFSLSNFTNFSSKDVFSQIDDNIKNYINNLSVIF